MVSLSQNITLSRKHFFTQRKDVTASLCHIRRAGVTPLCFGAIMKKSESHPNTKKRLRMTNAVGGEMPRKGRSTSWVTGGGGDGRGSSAPLRPACGSEQRGPLFLECTTSGVGAAVDSGEAGPWMKGSLRSSVPRAE